MVEGRFAVICLGESVEVKRDRRNDMSLLDNWKIMKIFVASVVVVVVVSVSW